MSNGHNGKLVESVSDRIRRNKMVVAALDALRERRPVSAALDPEQITELHSRYSHFEDSLDSRGFLRSSRVVVTAVDTPRPYLHLIGSNHSHEYGTYGSFWDQSCGGFSCLDSVLAGSVTSHKDSSYVPTAPRSTDQRHFWLREQTEGGSPAIWHVFPQRGVQEDCYSGFRCEQGLGTVKISALCNGIRAELTVFVPVEGPLELWRLSLCNESGRARALSLFLAVNWGLESYPGYYFDPRVVSQGRRYEELNALVALNRDHNNKHPRTGFLMSREAFDSFDMSGEEFTGGGHFRRFPQAVENGCCRGSLGVQPYLGLVSAMQFGLSLKAGESRDFDFLLGVTDSDIEKGRIHLEGLRNGYFRPGGVESELERLKENWDALTGAHLAATDDTEINRFFNVWSKYQAKNSARWTRALDKVGYRDILQDLLGVNSFDPEYTRTMLPVTLRYQLEDGRAVRQFAKFAGAPHDLRMYMDSSSWIPDTLVGYIKETGDMSILEQEEGFYSFETDRVETAPKATVYEHALRAVRGLYEHRGLHGLCRIGHGDWNDALDGVGRDDRGVSVWLSMALVFAARRMRELTVLKADSEGTALMDRIIAEMTGAINTKAWDDDHYVYAFTGEGMPVGSGRSAEGRIHLNVNTWSLFNGVAEAAGRLDTVLKSISALDTPLGHLLLFPSYTEKSRGMGRICDMVPGQFENGSIYTHGQSFLVYALCELGQGDRALEELKKALPEANLPDIATGPPHQISNFTVGIEHEHFGRNLYSNFSGAMAWLRKSLDRMFGLLPQFDSLVVDPVAPSAWKEFRVLKQFRGCSVEARFRNPRGVCRGVKAAALDGKPLSVSDGKVSIPAANLAGRKDALLEVELG
ncbi:hypothetical protein LLH00_15865 [bacterium]|nr:hypothetical protein [bacterium]